MISLPDSPSLPFPLGSPRRSSSLPAASSTPCYLFLSPDLGAHYLCVSLDALQARSQCIQNETEYLPRSTPPPCPAPSSSTASQPPQNLPESGTTPLLNPLTGKPTCLGMASRALPDLPGLLSKPHLAAVLPPRPRLPPQQWRPSCAPP